MTGARAVVVVVALLMPSPAWTQTALPDLSLEEAMKLDAGRVFGASERMQPVMEAPSSVSFITADEIARYGYRTLADILRSVRGMYVSDDRNFSLMGTRGFAKPGDYNTRILLLINGHRVNDNVLGQAEIGAELGLDPAIFERVEVIRGPGSSVYGDSAFLAVVNVITRTGLSIGGGSMTLETGTQGAQLARATVGQRFANGVDVALSGTYENSDGVGRLYFPAFDAAATNNGVAEGLDGEGVRQFYGQVTHGGLTVTGAYGHRRREVPTASFGTLFNSQDPRDQTTSRHTLVDAEYRRSFGGTGVSVRTSFDRLSFDGTYPFTAWQDGVPPLVGRSGVVGARWSAGSGLTRVFRGRQTVAAGIELIDNIHQDQTSGSSASPVLTLDSRRSSTQHAVYLQDEIRLTRWLIVNAGLRYDGYEDFQRVTPRAALIVLPSSTQSFKYLHGRAFRAPNALELNAFYFGEQVESLRPESINTHELVWERYLDSWMRMTVSTYWYKADRLITEIADDSTPAGLTYVNQVDVRAKGVELEAQMRLDGETRAFVSYARQSAVEQETGAGLPNSPRQMAKARLSVAGPTPRSIVSIEGRYLASRTTLAGSKVSATTLVHATMIQPLAPSWELIASVRNIFDLQYADPASSHHRQDSIPQNGRTARIGIRWQLWKK